MLCEYKLGRFLLYIFWLIIFYLSFFLVVVVGGVGQVWGAVLAALGLGISGTVLEIGMGAVLAKIILLVLVILFIQKRPQGLFAIKGRFVE